MFIIAQWTDWRIFSGSSLPRYIHRGRHIIVTTTCASRWSAGDRRPISDPIDNSLPSFLMLLVLKKWSLPLPAISAWSGHICGSDHAVLVIHTNKCAQAKLSTGLSISTTVLTWDKSYFISHSMYINFHIPPPTLLPTSISQWIF